MNKPQPRSLIEAIRYFADLDVATEFVKNLRWADGPVCDRCGTVDNAYWLASRRVFKCKNGKCGRQFSVKVGTIFEDSPLGLDKWLPAVWLIANSKNGVSSHELGRALGVTQKSAWFMLHRIRLAMSAGSFDKLDGTVEADETFVGGLTKNMHAAKRNALNIQGGKGGKTVVAGVLSRDGEVRATVVPNAGGVALQAFVRSNVEKNATLYTDAWHAYRALGSDFDHAIVDHHLNQHVNGTVHTNGIESFWALLKRSIKGAYVSVSPSHLIRYVDERVFAFNNRKGSDFDRFALALSGIADRRITYAELTGKA
jgi:transposase-like protein